MRSSPPLYLVVLILPNISGYGLSAGLLLWGLVAVVAIVPDLESFGGGGGGGSFFFLLLRQAARGVEIEVPVHFLVGGSGLMVWRHWSLGWGESYVVAYACHQVWGCFRDDI